ncbi:hypothetical protein DPMN_164147 [Dreissena polymorpha]|uniref:Uncharacterized protein n=1 Tax=Dreissena polymorpha TaxID=45954 RepID=A0A9D4EUL4_DREPO|nr:hypothetical protein DPMN_164147 [Dreissena polymorpha]
MYTDLFPHRVFLHDSHTLSMETLLTHIASNHKGTIIKFPTRTVYLHILHIFLKTATLALEPPMQEGCPIYKFSIGYDSH